MAARRAIGHAKTAVMPMRRIGEKPDSLNAATLLEDLARAAERYVNKAPKQQRLAAERQALLDVLTRAQLFISVERSDRKAP